VFKHIGSNWTLVFLQMGVMLLLTPLMQSDAQGVGAGSYGMFLSIVSLIGFIELLALGVPMATVKHITEGVASGDAERTNRAFATSIGIALGLGAVALVVGALLYFPFEVRLDKLLAMEAGEAPPDARVLGISSAARVTFALIAVHGAFAFVLRLPYALFEAHHDFTTKNLIRAGGFVLRMVLVIGLLAWRPSIVMLAVAVAACTLFEFTCCLLVIRRKYPEVRPAPRHFDRTAVRGVFNFSIFATLVSVGSLLAFRMDGVVIYANLTADDVTAYANGNVFFEPLIGLMLGIGAVMMPTATRLAAQGRRSELVPILERWMRIGLTLQLLVCGYLVAFGPEFVGRWIDVKYESLSGPITQVIGLSFIVFLPVRAVGLSALLGLGKAKRPAIGLLVMGLANLVLSLALVKPFGILGVALGTAIPNVIYAVWLLRELCNELEISMRKLLMDLLHRIPLGLLPPVALAIFMKSHVGPDSWPMILGAGVLWSLVFGLSWGFYVYRGDPHLDLRIVIAKLRARLGGGGEG